MVLRFVSRTWASALAVPWRKGTSAHYSMSYAPRFDQALTAGLNYRGPELLFRAVEASHAGGRMKFGSVLDLGCGTGLAALPFRPFSDWMVGVDLSSGMLVQARTKGLYDRLIEKEILAFLTNEAEIGGHYLPLCLRPMFSCTSTTLRLSSAPLQR